MCCITYYVYRLSAGACRCPLSPLSLPLLLEYINAQFQEYKNGGVRLVQRVWPCIRGGHTNLKKPFRQRNQGSIHRLEDRIRNGISLHRGTMRRVFKKLFPALSACIISGIIGLVIITAQDFVLLHFSGFISGDGPQVYLPREWTHGLWLDSRSSSGGLPNWSVAVLYYTVGAAVGRIIWFKHLSMWKAIVCGSLLCYVILGAYTVGLITFFTLQRGSPYEYEKALRLMLVIMGTNAVVGALLGLLSWVICRYPSGSKFLSASSAKSSRETEEPPAYYG